MAYILRAMQEADLEQVVEIEKKSFPSPWSIFAFQCELADNDFAHYLVVTPREAGQQICGYGGIWVIIDEAHLTNVAVAPQYRGEKLGKLLLEGLEMMAQEKGAVRMSLEVRVSNERAKELYQKRGFVPVGLRPHYYVVGNEAAIVMCKEFEHEAED